MKPSHISNLATSSIRTSAIFSLGFSILSASIIPAHAQSNSGAAKLRFLLGSHVYTGQRVTQDVRNATGDPNIQVIDRRNTFGEVYRCSYVYRGNPRYRTLVCD